MNGHSVIRLLSRQPAGLVILALFNVTLAAFAGDDPSMSTEVVRFERDVQPILRRQCYRCHGPSQQEGGFTLARRASALGKGDSDEPLVVPGKPDQSLLIRRLHDADAGDVMPLDSKPLSSRDIDVLRHWIESGAAWPDEVAVDRHWAYVPPVRPPVPAVTNRAWPRTPVDRFILRRLEQEGIEPAEEATRARWLRRVSLGLTGLPPTIGELDRFLADHAPDAREQAVERLLSSPSYGEHWARFWLDLARYADSNGFQADQYRDIWPYRDWVIRAFNRDMPFDRFVIEQLAGDLLPNATLDQKIATGFHRTVPCNVEAGVDPEANRVNQVFDRVSTTGTVFLGTTLECCQCHDHKYDPFTMKDYYSLFAFFNNTPLEVKHTGGVTYDFYGPKLKLPRKQGVGEGTDAPTTLVMLEMASPRETHIFERGDYLAPGAKVDPDVPARLHAFDDSLPRNRLGLARWLVSRDNPLLARVTVNRIWAELFGRGLVTTLEDFGTQSEPPTHPELLDWLAVEFMESGWSIKHLQRQIVLSATFGQSSRLRFRDRKGGRTAFDPENRWYARGPRFRLPAETIRDNALAISGLLSKKMYGRPVMPYQPKGVWRSIGRNQPKWKTAKNEDRFRRGVYVMWKRAAPYPSFTTFDAPDRGSCTVRRPRTNTPLQALTLLNDPAYAEIAVGLAQRIVAEADSESAECRAAYGFRLCVSRMPSPEETAALVALYRLERAKVEAHPDLIRKRIGNLPQAWRRPEADRREVAAWFAVANALLNLDETIND